MWRWLSSPGGPGSGISGQRHRDEAAAGEERAGGTPTSSVRGSRPGTPRAGEHHPFMGAQRRSETSSSVLQLHDRILAFVYGAGGKAHCPAAQHAPLSRFRNARELCHCAGALSADVLLCGRRRGQGDVEAGAAPVVAPPKVCVPLNAATMPHQLACADLAFSWRLFCILHCASYKL